MDDLVHEACPHFARWSVDPGGPSLASLGDDLPGSRVELLLDPPDPLIGSEHDLRVLRAHLGEHCEVAGQIRNQLELALTREVDDAVGDLDVGQPELLQPAFVVVHLVLRDHRLEERSADHDGLPAQHVELCAQVRRDVGGAPAELDDVDVVARRLEHVLPRMRAEALVDHVSQAGGTRRQAQIKAAHRAPRA